MQSSHSVLFAVALMAIAFNVVVKAQLGRSSLMSLKDHVQYKDYFCVAKCLGLINQKCNPAPVSPPPGFSSSTGLPPTVAGKAAQSGPIKAGGFMGKGARSGISNRISPRSVEEPPVDSASSRMSSNIAPLDFGPPLNCSALSFVGMPECCDNTPKNFVFSKEDLEFCHGTSVEKMSSSLVEAVWEYILNQAQLEKPGPGTLDLSLPATLKKLGSTVCFVECIFRRKGLVGKPLIKNFDSNRFIDFKRVASDLSASVSDEWSPIVKNAIIECSDALPVVHPLTTIELQEGFRTTVCRTQPFLLLQCLRKSLLLQCPSPDKRIKSMFCDLSLQNLQYCDPFQYSNSN